MVYLVSFIMTMKVMSNVVLGLFKYIAAFERQIDYSRICDWYGTFRKNIKSFY